MSPSFDDQAIPLISWLVDPLGRRSLRLPTNLRSLLDGVELLLLASRNSLSSRLSQRQEVSVRACWATGEQRRPTRLSGWGLSLHRSSYTPLTSRRRCDHLLFESVHRSLPLRHEAVD